MAAMIGSREPTVLWARRRELVERMTVAGGNPDYFGGPFPQGLRVTASLPEALDGAQVVVLCVPSHGVRAVLASGSSSIDSEAVVVSLAKGLEEETLLRVTEIVGEVVPGRPTAVLTGPNLVSEIVAGSPTASVVAAADPSLARLLQALFTTELFRVYTNSDVVGCELGGALKNVFAIAAGLADGLGFGDNTRAALITRSLAELARLGTALGGRPETFAGLTGMGDLVATCTSRHSRNRALGEQLAQGRTLAQLMTETRAVAEGVRTSLAVIRLAARHEVEMPIAEQVAAVLHHGLPVTSVVAALMGRASRGEWDGAA